MKQNFTRVLIALAVIVCCYTACTKNTLKPASGTVAITDYKSLSSQIASQFYKSITGQYGGTNVNDGITLPSNLKATGQKGLKLNSITSLCGFVIDTTYKYTTGTDPVHDTVKTFFGNFHFLYTCDASQVNGYVVSDSLVNTEAFKLYNLNTYMVSQKYTVKALDQTYKLVSMDGSISTLNKTANIEALTSTSLSSSYLLSGLRVNFASGTADVTTGVATFQTSAVVTNTFTPAQNSTVNYTGTIQFLGNHKAKLTINNTNVYMVDLITGVVTPA